MVGDPKTLVALIVLFSLYANLGASMYGVIARKNLVKKLICLTMLGDTVNVFAILVGYRLSRGGTPVPPVFTEWSKASEKLLANFVSRSVDPLPQALVLTAIVINLAVTIFLATLILYTHRHFGTVEMDRVSEMKKGELVDEVEVS